MLELCSGMETEMKKIIVLFLLLLLSFSCHLPPSFDVQYFFDYTYQQTTSDRILISIELHITNYSLYEIKSVILSFEGNEIDGNRFGFRSPSIGLNLSETKSISFDAVIGVLHDPAVIENLQVTRTQFE